MVLVNDENVSNEILEAITKNSDSIRLVELVRKEDSGRLTFWSPSGKIIDNNTIEIPNAEMAKMEPREVSLILETSLSNVLPKSVTDKPAISCNVAGVKAGRGIVGADKHVYNLLKIGIPQFKFSNLRFAIQTRTFAGTLSAAPGSVKTISDVEFKVVGPTVDQTNNQEHFTMTESGYTGMDNFLLVGLFDWDSVERDLGPVKNKSEVVNGRLVRKQGEPTDPKDMHIDFTSKRPLKYLSKIVVLRGLYIQGYFQHIATEPAGN